MILSKNIISVAINLFAVLCLNISYAQDNEVNSSEKKQTDSLILAMRTSIPVFGEITTITDNPAPLPFTKPVNKLPNKLYNTWNNKDIRLNSDKSFNKNTTYILPLLSQNDHRFVFPYKGKIISPFGYRGRKVHAGTDIKLALNDEVYAAFDGEVRMAKRYSGYGNLVVIRHPNGLETCYGHLNKIKVKINQEVKAGDLIGLGGRTGRASTTHLHFETRFMGDAFNSSKLLDYDNYSLKSDTLVIDKNTFLKTKNFRYKKNKKGKRIKVYYESEPEEEISTNNTITSIIYPEENINKSIIAIDTSNNNEPLVINTVSKTIKKSITKVKTAKSKKLSFYKVRNGDTLSKIARNNGTTVKDICRINKLNENAVLSLGKKIKLK